MQTGIQKLKAQRDKFVRAIGTRAMNKWPVGTRYQRIVIVGHERQASGCWAVLCRCDCGKDKKVLYPNQMARGLVGSCGCLSRELAAQRAKGRAPAGKLEEGEASFNMLLREYKKSAVLRNFPFELTDDEFKTLVAQDCVYCGAEATQRRTTPHYNREFIYNGLDRVDTLRGYISDNVVPCCKQCNRAKRDLPLDDFLAWIVRVAKHLSI